MLSVGRFLEKGKSVPIMGIDATVRAMDFFAKVTLKQRFRNTRRSPMKIDFEIDLPPRATVSNFSVTVGEKCSKFSVEKKGSRIGSSSANLANVNSNSFFLELGAVPGGEEVLTTISYELMTTPVPVGDDFFFKLNLEKSDAEILMQSDIESRLPANDRFVKPGFNFCVYVCSTKKPLTKVYSYSHEIDVNKNVSLTEATVTLRNPDDWKMQRSFTLFYGCNFFEDPKKPVVMMQEKGATRIIMVVFPPVINNPDEKCEMSVVLDRSGSMEGEPIARAKATLDYLLHALPKQSLFNIIDFASGFNQFCSTPVAYNDSTLKNALGYVRGIQADGGTNLLDPLNALFKQECTPGFPRKVFVITDGYVNGCSKEGCITVVKNNAWNSQVFAFGIGDSVDEDLVKRLSAAGRGTFRMIPNTSCMCKNVMEVLELAIKPGLSQPTFSAVDSNGKTIPMFDLNQETVKSNYAVAFGVLPPECEDIHVEVSGSVNGEQLSHVVEANVKTVDRVSGETLVNVGASMIIERMVEDHSGTEAEITKLSLEAQVPSPFTCMTTGEESAIITPPAVAPEPEPAPRIVDEIIAEQESCGRFKPNALSLLELPESARRCFALCLRHERIAARNLLSKDKDVLGEKKLLVPLIQEMQDFAAANEKVRNSESFRKISSSCGCSHDLTNQMTLEERIEFISRAVWQACDDCQDERYGVLREMMKFYQIALIFPEQKCVSKHADQDLQYEMFCVLHDMAEQKKRKIEEMMTEKVRRMVPEAKLAEDVWITLVTVASLRKKYSQYQGDFAFVIDKSENWAHGILSDSYYYWQSQAEAVVEGQRILVEDSPYQDFIPIFVKTPSGKTVCVDIDPREDVYILNQIIQEKLPEYSADRMKLCFADKTLQDGHTLDENPNITKNCTIHLL